MGETTFAELVKNLRTKLGLSQERFAHLIEVTLRTVHRWEKGKEPDSSLKKYVTELSRLVDIMEPRLKERTTYWLKEPHPEFLHCSPLDVIKTEFGINKLQEWYQKTYREQEPPTELRR